MDPSARRALLATACGAGVGAAVALAYRAWIDDAFPDDASVEGFFVGLVLAIVAVILFLVLLLGGPAIGAVAGLRAVGADRIIGTVVLGYFVAAVSTGILQALGRNPLFEVMLAASLVASRLAIDRMGRPSSGEAPAP